MSAHLLTYPLPFTDINSNVIVGGTIEFYEAGGSSTPKEVWSEYTLTTSAGFSVDTDAYGLPEKSGTSIEVYGDGDYYVIIKDAAGNQIRDYEWLEEIFIQTEPDEWVTSGLTPSYISATSFSVPGDKTELLDVGRMLKIQLTSSIIYRPILTSTYTTLTTITVSTGLTSPISSFEYSFLSGINQSLPSPAKVSLGDLNGFKALGVETVASAISGVKLTPAATGNNPAINVDGEDVGLDIEGVTSKNGDINATTGTITDIIADSVTAEAVNGNLDLDGNGSGRARTKGTSIYGMVILDTPIQLIDDSTLTATTQTAVDITAHTTGVAVKAILNVQNTQVANATVSSTADVLIGEGDETLVTEVHTAVKINGDAGTTLTGNNQVTVNLATGEIFDYAIIQAGGAPVARNVTIYLAGYYV